MGEGSRKHGMMRHGSMMGAVAMRLSSYLQSDGPTKMAREVYPTPNSPCAKSSVCIDRLGTLAAH
jgi:hypothetical protein